MVGKGIEEIYTMCAKKIFVLQYIYYSQIII